MSKHDAAGPGIVRTVLALAGSLWIGALLLMLLVVAMACATVHEAAHGTPSALADFYHARWFLGLLGLVSVNILASLLARWPWNRRHAGLLLTHGGLLLVVAGALITGVAGVDGQLAIYEGETARQFLVRPPAGSTEEPRTVDLNFAITLNDFEIGYYAGTMRPRSFASHIVVTGADGAPQARTVSMNRPVKFGGYTFFQSSYVQGRGPEMSVLSVAKDPGQAVVFGGYIVCTIGLVWVLVGRMRMERRLAALAAKGGAA